MNWIGNLIQKLLYNWKSHTIATQTTARLIKIFPPIVVKMNFEGLNLAIPRRIITMSSGGIGEIAATNDTRDPYFADINH